MFFLTAEDVLNRFLPLVGGLAGAWLLYMIGVLFFQYKQLQLLRKIQDKLFREGRR